jgi:magnesium transporter
VIRSYVYRKKNNQLDRDVPFSEYSGILKDGQDLIWLDIEDKLDEDEVELLTEVVGLHPIAIEDCIMVNTRPKVEHYDDYIFAVVHTAANDLASRGGKQIELNIFLSKQFLISVHQGRAPSISVTEERLKRNPSILGAGTDRLFHTIYDKLVDNYFPLMDKVDDVIDDIEDEVLEHPDPKVLARMVEVRKDLVSLHRVVSPLRETTHLLVREGFDGILQDEIRIYFRDVYDHLVRVLDLIDTYRDTLSTTFEAYHFMMSTRMNEVMKTLTMIATIMMPLTVITGIYGMNFKFMPEINHPLGYFSVLTVMGVLTLLMLLFFRRKQWL